MFATRNDLPEATRARMIEALNLGLADAVALQTQAKQAHWNVRGPHFIGLHRLFDEVADAARGYADRLAERAVQLGGVAEGTAKAAVERARLRPYPRDIAAGRDHCAALAAALAAFGAGARRAIGEADAAGDKDTADLFTEVSRGADGWLWMVEAHLQADA